MESEQYLSEEAAAFDKRIRERLDAGFYPDLRRARKCEFFYKSFWRDPQFIELYLGWILDGYLDLLRRHCGAGLRILDVGCGAGYMSLELARHGHHVTAIDISEECIAIARIVAGENPFTDGFGSLCYEVASFGECVGSYDVVLFSVSMHHMSDIPGVVEHTGTLLPTGGHLLLYEPCHERFRKQDAAQVALIRGLLSLTGCWFDEQETAGCFASEQALGSYVDDLHLEYVLERDKDEPEGQSPHDLEASGEEILQAVRTHFEEIEMRPGCSFIYRVLGGIRGTQEQVRRIAELLTIYERHGVASGHIRENMFYYLGRKPPTNATV